MRGRTPLSFARGRASLGALLVCVGCGHDWDDYDPRSAAGSGDSASSSLGAGAAGGDSASSSGASGGAGASGGSTGGGGGSEPIDCGGFDILGEDFEDGVLGGDWGAPTLAAGGTVTETEGAVVVTLPSGVAGVAKGYLTTKRRHDLVGDRVSISVPVMVNTATTAGAGFSLLFDSDNYVRIFQRQGTLRFTQRIAGAFVELATVPYDAGEHAHWRFREEEGTLYWETSSDAVGWDVQVQAATSSLFPLDRVRLELSGVTLGGEIDPGEVRFDDLNDGGAPAGKWCPASYLTDDFADGVQGPAWARSAVSNGGTMTETDGELLLVPPATSSGSAVYTTGSAYNLTGNEVVVELPTMVATDTDAQAYLRLENDSDYGLSIAQQSGTIAFRFEEAGTTVVAASLLYNADAHRWWRIREAGGTVYWETAPDGKAWVVRAEMVRPPVDVTELDVRLGAATYAATATPGAAHFDNYNLPPP